MFRKSFGVAAIVLATLLALPSLAQDASKKQKSTAASRAASGAAAASVPIPVTNSAKDTEITIAKLLKDRLQLDSSLKLVDDNPDNLRLLVSFRTNDKQGIPRIRSVIDTAIVARDKDGNAVSQTIYIAASADITLNKGQEAKLLQWANAWNARMLPIRVFITANRVYTGAAVLGTRDEPASSNRVLGSFLSVVRAWPAVLRDLRANKFIPETKPAKKPAKKK